jgi:hypothetical protein
MKTIAPVVAVALLLPGCANGLLHQLKRTSGATPRAAVSAPKPRPAAPAGQVPPATTPQLARKAPRPASAPAEARVEEAEPAPRRTAPVAAAAPVAAPQPVPEPTRSEPTAVAPPVTLSDPAPAPPAPPAVTPAPDTAPPPVPEPPRSVQATSPALSFTPIREAQVGRCDCPYDLTSSGVRCGGSSDWSRPGGHDPVCYVHQGLGPSLFTSDSDD